MSFPARVIGIGLAVTALTVVASRVVLHRADLVARVSAVTVQGEVAHDQSLRLTEMPVSESRPADTPECEAGCGVSPTDPDHAEERGEDLDREGRVPVRGEAMAIEQRSHGDRAPAAMVASFDGLGAGFVGPQGSSARLNNPSDNALAVGHDHIVQLVNGGMAVYTKKGKLFDTTGKVLYGPVAPKAIFTGFGGPCESRNSGEGAVRYDQLADRWLYVFPVFQRDSEAGDARNHFSMCYAVSVGTDPLGPYYRYEFSRAHFPDYPRPAIWPDGYYISSSTGDRVEQRHACVVDRAKMLLGLPATEQCLVVDGVSFLNNADLDGTTLPPQGAPNIVMAAGGSQLRKQFEDGVIYSWKFHADWEHPDRTTLIGPEKITVAPYHYLCDGQRTSCVPQSRDSTMLDGAGDRLMPRVIYRRVDGRESILAVHSVNTSAGAGGVRWYEFRLNAKRTPVLFQQGTFAPDSSFRWLPSVAMDQQGNIGIGYSFGSAQHFPGQRFAGRLADDPKGELSLREAVLMEGEGAQRDATRWEDFTTMVIDPSDDCTFWYVGDYFKSGEASYSSHIGAFLLPGCPRSGKQGVRN